MTKYRKKPVVIEAIQLTPDSINAVREFMQDAGSHRISAANVIVVIHTLEGDMIARDGDYIIKGVQGEFYPCKPDIFLTTYELASL